ncbi:DUF2530 domain-containing protein [Bombiscardovia coagulans]|uniref:DUF2530 domain-containing protein n=1 Tax=Bombiscardovia coagulans TaxID=686666 RepID=A0A261EUB1_9BIFI|nr:DUF2530 domain-containing protein [Bombiscardovia coagulans]OZG50236.1 hypothetical protein BOCO_0753 [Bombiscardovia coagulans]
MKLAPIFDPDARRPSPKPVQVDLRLIFWAGTGLWALALIILAALTVFGVNTVKPMIVCASGVVIGLLMLVWEHCNRRDYRRLAL